MSKVSMNTVIKAKLFSDLLKHLDDVATALMIQRDDMLDETDKNNDDLDLVSIEELNDMLNKNEEIECDIRTLLITEVDKIHEEMMKI